MKRTSDQSKNDNTASQNSQQREYSTKRHGKKNREKEVSKRDDWSMTRTKEKRKGFWGMTSRM